MAKSKGKPWEKSASGRKIDSRERRRTVIFCEDSKSSACYFRSFKIDKERFEVRVEGTGMNTDSLVGEAIRAKLDAEKRKTPFNEVWCVFDRDDFPLENYERAFTLARNQGIKIAWANEAFEFWYLLHFDYFDTAVSRADYKRKLADRKIEYDKADWTIYTKLLPKQEPRCGMLGGLRGTGTRAARLVLTARTLPPTFTSSLNSLMNSQR